jgi:hypothetical protein
MLEALGNIGDFAGGIGVIVTLAYLAVQIRHNTRAARAATLQQWVTMTATVNIALSQSGEFARIYRAGCEDSKHLEPQERTQFNTYCLQVFNAFESLFFQAQQGAVEQAFFESKVQTMRATLTPPGVRSWWDSIGSQNFDCRLRQFVARELLR